MRPGARWICAWRWGQPHRHGRRVLERAGRGDRRRGAGRPPGRGAGGHQGAEAMGDGPNDAGLSQEHIISGCEASLRRLRTDHIDLYQVHEWDGVTPLEETLEALDLLVRAGKVRYVGCSNYAGWQLMKALGLARPARPAPVRQRADLLLAAVPGRRVRADPGRGRPGPGRAGVEPAGGWPAVRQVPPGPAAGRPAPGSSPTGTSRRCTTRTSCTTRWTCWWTSASSTGCRPARVAAGLPAGQARGHLAGDRRADQRSNWPTTWPRPTWN